MFYNFGKTFAEKHPPCANGCKMRSVENPDGSEPETNPTHTSRAPTEGAFNLAGDILAMFSVGCNRSEMAAELQQALDDARNAALEEAAQVNLDRTGREWVRDSLWDNMAIQLAHAIRALKRCVTRRVK